jgi:uncharacterized iron-regulated membrane protein
MRKFFLKIHRWLAIPFGIFFAILCFTGMLLTFRHEIAAMCGVSNDHDLAFFRAVQSMHQFLFMSPASHDSMSVGKFIIGITALCSILILISGIIIWWPSNKKMLKNRFSVHFHKGWHRFVYDSHVSLGIYAVIFLLLMALTGPTMSFRWYEKGASAVVGMKSNAQNEHFGKPFNQVGNQQPQAVNSHHETTLSDKAQLNKHDNHGPMNSHRFFMKLHGGQWIGFVGEIIYFFAALIGGFLPISGYYMWWRRWKNRKRRASQSVAEKA